MNTVSINKGGRKSGEKQESIPRGREPGTFFGALGDGLAEDEFVVAGGEGWEAARSFKLSVDLQYRQAGQQEM